MPKIKRQQTRDCLSILAPLTAPNFGQSWGREIFPAAVNIKYGQNFRNISNGNYVEYYLINSPVCEIKYVLKGFKLRGQNFVEIKIRLIYVFIGVSCGFSHLEINSSDK